MTEVARLWCRYCSKRAGRLDRADDDGTLVLVAEVHVATPPDAPADQPDADWFLTASPTDIAAHLAGIPDGKGRPRREARYPVAAMPVDGSHTVWECPEPGCNEDVYVNADDCRAIASEAAVRKSGKLHSAAIPIPR